MTIEADGRRGQELALDLFHSWKCRAFQADWIVRFGEEFYLYEVKFQEPYSPPPFWGHGLPLWQVKDRLEFQRYRNVRAVLLVFDKQSGATYQQFLDELEAGPHFDTKGQKPRRVYPLESFRQLESWQANSMSAKAPVLSNMAKGAF